MLVRASFISALAIFFHYQSCMGRQCRDNSLSIHQAKFSFHHEEILHGTADNFTLHIRLNWTISGVKNDEFDGYLVRLRDTGTYESASPVDDCEASSTHVWIKTDNRSMCAEGNEPGLQCTTELATYGNFCACNKMACPALLGGCSGTTLKMKEIKLLYYRSLPNIRQSIKFGIKFNVEYKLYIIPYYRNFVASAESYPITYNFRCAELVAATFGLSQPEANQKCCRSGVFALAPTNFRREEIILDRRTNTLNLTVSWIPPALNRLLDGVYTLTHFISTPPTEEFSPSMTVLKIEGSIVGNETCALDNRRQTSTVYNLLPNVDYKITIAAAYSGELNYKCRRGKCGLSARIRIDFDPCDKKWTPCSPGFRCIIIDGGEDAVLVPETKCVLDTLTASVSTSTPVSARFPSLDQTTTNNSMATRAKGNIFQTTYADTFNAYSTSSPDARSPDSVPVTRPLFVTRVEGNIAQTANSGMCGSDPPYCSKTDTCDFDPITSSTTCSCDDDMFGDGISIAYGGTGCVECSLMSQCDSMASCVVAEPPSTGFMCRCDEVYYGDGLKTGSGCNSRAKRTATIAVPLVLLGVLLLIFLTWYLCSRGKRKYHTSNKMSI